MPNNIKNSVLRYNGIDIPYLKTEKFTQEPIWSQDGADLLYTHITIGVSGVLNKCFLYNGIDPACWIEAARPALLQRGQQLYFYIGGTQIIPPPDPVVPNNVMPNTGNELVASPNYTTPTNSCSSISGTAVTATLDAKLGPRPLRLEIKQIQGGSYIIYYEIETWLPYCNGTSLANPILSNRWESTVDIDKDYYYTRTTTGRMILNTQYSSTLPAPTLLSTSPYDLLIFPPLFNNWKREVVRFNLSSDQTTIDYSIVDRQQYVAMQTPAVHIEASYSEVSPAPQAPSGIAMINIQQVNMDITVTGDPNVLYPNSYPTPVGDGTVYPDQLKYALMQIMFQIVFSRKPFPFTAKGQAWQNNEYITHFELREDVMKPIVGCRISAFKTRALTSNSYGSAADWQTNVFALTNVGQPLYLNNMLAQIATQPISIGNWASALLLLSVQPKYPCSTPESPAVLTNFFQVTYSTLSTQTASTNQTIGTGGAYNRVVNLNYSNANYKFPFTEYHATVEWPTNYHTVQAPIMYDVETGGPGTTAASSVFFKTASPTSRKVVHWRASRMGAWPKAPNLNAVDTYGGSLPSDYMLNATFGVGEVELSQDGITRHYHTCGTYEIGMARRVQWDVPSTVLSTICFQIIGSSTYGDADSSFPTNNFVSGILNQGPSPGNS